ncbi:GtrA-like protein [Arthrobacter ulcerisalmonis]|uniref:GtrA-like protein n=1 Tax=Arthrobacter ulcerisalmonis TaxID=2483813 RepID=A0A3P5XYY7_9MICC|nr:GtrA-like protein [Arthrobacter ulcerisalmonis]
MEPPIAPAEETAAQPAMSVVSAGAAATEVGVTLAPSAGSATSSQGRRRPTTRFLRFPIVRQLIRFSGVGVICTLASLGLYALLRPWLGPQLANATALIVTSLLNTALNRRLTFKITGSRRRARDHVSGLVVILVALVITGGSLGVLHAVRPEATVTEELWTTTLSGFLATAVRFTMLRHWIFRRARHV